MLTVDSPFQEFTTLCIQGNACDEGVAWCVTQGDVTCDVAFTNMVTDEEFLDMWGFWSLWKIHPQLSEELQLRLVDVFKHNGKACHQAFIGFKRKNRRSGGLFINLRHKIFEASGRFQP